jgi:hypothetical protein
VVVRQRQVHHGPDLDLAVHCDRPHLRGVHAKDGALLTLQPRCRA